MTMHKCAMVIAASTALVMAVTTLAQDKAAESAEGTEATSVLDQLQGQMRQQPATQPKPTEKPGAADVMDDVQKDIQRNPMIEPAQQPGGASRPSPAIRTNVDPAVLGVAPGMTPPKLRREGDFVISRRGRLVPSTDGARAMFVFESDGTEMSDPPMVLVPCQTLQSMEDLVSERGARIVFVLSGQILEYRGMNYLLPTMMKLDIDRGNLDK